MKRIISLLTVLIFTLWVLPLGVFVRAEQEKKFCGGKRAICLCKHLIDKQMAKNAGKVILSTTASAPEKESGPSSSPHFMLPGTVSVKRPGQALALSNETTFYSFLFSSIIEHVPKHFLI